MAKKGQYTYEYPHPAVTADCVVFGYDGKELKVLLIKRGLEKEASTRAYVGEWALPGGFLDVETDKTVAHTAARELKEETGLKLSVKDFKEVGTFSDIKILRVAFSRLKQDIHFEPVGFELLPEVFTLPQLQNLYESILEVKFDRRNFANKMKHFEILSEVEDGTPRKGTRTPIKYRFEKENYERLKRNGFQLEF